MGPLVLGLGDEKMTGTLILIALTIAFAVSCVLLRRKNQSFAGMICKFMASFGFISVAILGNYLNPVNPFYFSFTCIALMFGFCGDVFLGIKEIAPTFKKKLIPVGTAYFLIGHIFNIIALSSFNGFKPILGISVLLGAAFALILIKSLKAMVKGGLLAILCIYYGFLFWKLSIAIDLIIGQVNTVNILILCSAILFLISDTCLGILYFTPVKKKNFLVTAELSTYYPAQILMAMSVMML